MYNPARHHRRSIRLRGYDYTCARAYFVTLCVQGRECLFGEIDQGKMWWNDLGGAVAECWQWMIQRYEYVELDEWVVMPNHLHGIIVIRSGTDPSRRGDSRIAPTYGGIAPTVNATDQNTRTRKTKSLGRLIGAFKTVSTKRINALWDAPGRILWQRNYHEHIIRNVDELHRIREYIANNPRQWDSDQENPGRQQESQG